MRVQKDDTDLIGEGVGKYSKKVDSALPGKYTRKLYDLLSWKDARVLA